MATIAAAQPFAFEFDPAATALVVIDMQRDFLEPGGFGETLGNDVSLLSAIVRSMPGQAPVESTATAAAALALSLSDGRTLVASLHQVDIALAHFPRIVGLRDGRIAFDLPAAEVTRAQLAHLYAQHEDEWLGGGAADADAEAPPAPAPPAVMHCR